MTRKSKKGIVGKEKATSQQRYKVGPGIDFVDENLKTSDEIEKEIEERNKR